MNKYGVVNIVWSFPKLVVGVKAKEMIALMEALPKDSEIVAIGEYYNRACGYIRIKSNDFKEVHETHNVPEVVPTFINHKDGSVYCSIDLSSVIDPESISMPIIIPVKQLYGGLNSIDDVIDEHMNDAIIYGSSVIKMNFEEKQNDIINSTINTFRESLIEQANDNSTLNYINNLQDCLYNRLIQVPKRQGYVYIPYPHTGKQEIAEKELECNHTWKSYVGFTSCYDYCMQCDAKKNT